ncbi:unnamed protein product [Ectocarpus sp. CCAP 1310/34]|nr:unnamed protein product [Ectocarpus sp. CCAP 1310/34]
MNTATPIYRVVSSHEEAIAASAAKSILTQELQATAARNKELCQTAKDKEKEFQAQLDRFMEYPKAAERMAEELERCKKTARREKNLMVLERKEFRRQLHMFQKWQTENSNLREKARAQEMQVVALRRQLAVTESGLAGSASTRKAVIGGTVDRLQRAETAAKHQAHKYRELAGARGVQAAQLKAEISSLKATIKTLRLKLEPPAHDSYETEIARLARVNPEVLDIQQKSGLSKEDMEASMVQLKLLREKEEQKDALIALARERDEFALCIKDLRARNSWLEKQMLKTPDALRSVAEERVAAAAPTKRPDNSKRSETSSNHGWISSQNGGSRGIKNHASPDRENEAAPRLANQSWARHGSGEARVGSTARVRRTIKMLENCDWSIEKQRERETNANNNVSVLHGGGGGGGASRGPVAAVLAVRQTSRKRPQSAQGLCRPPASSPGGSDIGSGETGVLPLRCLFPRGGRGLSTRGA